MFNTKEVILPENGEICIKKSQKSQGLCLHFLLRNPLHFVKHQKTEQRKLLDRQTTENFG